MKHLILFILAILISTPLAFAKPERMVLKAPEAAAREKQARLALRNLDLRDIEDPAARKAIREILHYLKLKDVAGQ